MALIDLFLSRAVTRGTLTLHRPDVATKTFGTSEAGFPDVVIRFTDKNVGRSIVSDPGLGAAEAFMDGRLVIEQGDIRALVELLTSNDPWEDGRSALAASPLRRAVAAAAHRFGRINMERASKRNVAHHYDLSDRLYDLFLDADRQYSCAYFTDPANSLEHSLLW
jgi:cyclopropane-fatty-acyl-phospholipid synthase